MSVIPEKKFKVVILGEHSVGKSALVTRFVYNKFKGAYFATIGIEFVSKSMDLEDRSIRLQLWDTAGQERFGSIITSYIRNCDVAIVVYDITDLNSFKRIHKWINLVKEERGDDAIIMLVGNKVDLTNDRKISVEEGKEKANELNLLFVETSAKTGTNVKHLFKKVAVALPKSDDLIQQQPSSQSIEKVDLTEKTPEKFSSNCACLC